MADTFDFVHLFYRTDVVAIKQVDVLFKPVQVFDLGSVLDWVGLVDIIGQLTLCMYIIFTF